MSELLVLVGSDRKRGNSELVGRLALRKARAKFNRGELVFLRDFDVKVCNGCMACVFKEKRCPLEDDFYALLDRINWASHIIIVAPTYLLMPPARLKLLLDRYIAAYPKIERKKRFGASISILALKNYAQFQIPYLNLFLLAFGFEPMVTREFIGAGPGEVLLDSGLEVGLDDVVNRLSGHDKEIMKGRCPYCLSSLIVFDAKDGYSCPICDIGVKIENGIPVYSGEPRWSEKAQEDHYQNWIMKTKDRFMSMLRDISRKKRELSL